MADTAPAGASADRATRERVAHLRDEIAYHRYRYYVLSDPRIPDGEFDALMLELEHLEREHPELDHPDSPTHHVGAPVSEAFTPVRHRLPMQSLDNAFDTDELRAWAARVDRGLDGAAHAFTCELKVDGVAISLVYEDGHLVQAVTRGDGATGEDVTTNVRTIAGIPSVLDLDRPPALLEVRGEIHYPVAAFEEMNAAREAAGEARFANPRNAASGALRQKDPEVTRTRPLALIAHGHRRRSRAWWWTATATCWRSSTTPGCRPRRRRHGSRPSTRSATSSAAGASTATTPSTRSTAWS
jgi:DNA ligase (NAD+)